MSSLLCFSLLAAAVSMREVPRGFLDIGTPEDSETYGQGSNCYIGGVLYLPDHAEEAVESLLLVVRLFKPVNGDFVIVTEVLGKPGDAIGDDGFYAFEAKLLMPQEAGRYLLRVACLDPALGEYPKTLIASQSIFLAVAARSDKQDGAGQQEQIDATNPGQSARNIKPTDERVTVQRRSNPTHRFRRIFKSGYRRK